MTRTDQRTVFIPWLSLVASAAAVGVYPSPLLQDWLQYDRAAIEAMQLWRMTTCHWAHWSNAHLFWDVSMFAVLSIACERAGRRLTGTTILAGVLGIPLAVWLLLPGMHFYRGLSGLDSMLFGLLAAQVFRQSLARRDLKRLAAVVIIAAAFAAKMLDESVLGSAVFVHDAAGMTPVPLAHVVGCVIGFTAGWLRRPRNRFPARSADGPIATSMECHTA